MADAAHSPLAYVAACCGLVVAMLGLLTAVAGILTSALQRFVWLALPLWAIGLVVMMTGIVLVGLPFLFRWDPKPS